MEFRKMVTITLYTRQQKRHWCIEQSFGLWGRGRGWDDLGEWHWNMYNIYEMSHQSRFDAWYWMLGAGTLGRPRGMVWRGRRKEGSGWGTRVCLWRIHFDIWQNQYNIVKFKNKIKLKNKKYFPYWTLAGEKKKTFHLVNKDIYLTEIEYILSHHCIKFDFYVIVFYFPTLQAKLSFKN